MCLSPHYPISADININVTQTQQLHVKSSWTHISHFSVRMLSFFLILDFGVIGLYGHLWSPDQQDRKAHLTFLYGNKYFLNEMELNIVFQYVTLLDSHFNIELFKSERENTINLVIILQSKYFYNFIGDTMKTWAEKTKIIQIWSDIKSGIS